MGQIVSLSLHRFEGRAARAWAFGMMGLARWPLSRVPGIGFWKLCGSGSGVGFLPRPNLGVYAILATWPGEAEARAAIEGAGVFRRYRARASEAWTILLRPVSARGAWSGRAPFEPQARQGTGPIAALTRGTVRARALPRFWARVPAISDRIGADREVLFKIGIGELPWLHQVTFSVWPDVVAMARFARTGAHAEAIAAVRTEGWFTEDLYARFEVAGEIGRWSGTPPVVTPQSTLHGAWPPTARDTAPPLAVPRDTPSLSGSEGAASRARPDNAASLGTPAFGHSDTVPSPTGTDAVPFQKDAAPTHGCRRGTAPTRSRKETA